MEESGTTSELLALIGFASRLGTCVSKEDGSIADDGDLRREAELLMSLMTSTPNYNSSHIEKPLDSDKDVGQSIAQPTDELQPHEVSQTQSSPYQQNFAFSCPSLSLDASSFRSKPLPMRRQVTDGDGDNETIMPSLHPPAVLLSRPLGVDDRDAMRLSAEAMARNVLQSFHTAVQWRIDTWANELAKSLVCQEQKLISLEASEDELKALLHTSEARVFASLHQGAGKIDVVDARTSYLVRLHRVDHERREYAKSTGTHSKKRKLETDCDSVYRVAHALSFQTVLNLSTPAGFTEVTLEAPGIIEGTFKSTKNGDETLIGVSVQVDTHVLARMMERSSRIVARTVAHAGIEARHTEPVIEDVEPLPKRTFSPPQDVTTAPSSDSEEPTQGGVVTPRYPSPPSFSYVGSGQVDMEKLAFSPLSGNLEQTASATNAFLRLVSPQPCCSEFSFTPRTPMKSQILVPSLISPQPSSATILSMETHGPSLPALVAAVCNAMRTASA